MGKRETILAVVVMLISAKAVSQELSHQVMVPAAGIVAVGNIEFTQTIGETAVLIFPGDYYTITQGFQQPRMIPETISKPSGTNVKVYPNPVSNVLTVELYGEEAKSYVISIVNLFGSVLYTTQLDFTGPYWYKLERAVDNLPAGLYMVRVVSRDRLVKRTFKIEKM